MTGCLHLNELNNNLEHNQNIPEIHILFSLHLQKNHGAFKKWICYQSFISSKSLEQIEILQKIIKGYVFFVKK